MVRRPIEPRYQTPNEAFIDRHMEIVKPMAGRLAHQLRAANELEDVTRTGVLGLVKAAATYNPDKGTERFWAWACVRREILSAYARGQAQHTGSDAYIFATCRQPLSEALCLPEPEPHTEEALPAYEVLTPRQQRLLVLLYEDGLTESAVSRGHLLGSAPHPNSKRRCAPINNRRVSREHQAALERLREFFSTTKPAA